MKKILSWVAALVVVLAAGYYTGIKYVLPAVIKEFVPQIEQMVDSYVNGSVKIGSIAWDGRFKVTLKEVQAFDLKEQLVANLPQTDLTLNPLAAYRDVKHAVTLVELQQPELYAREDKERKWNLQNYLKPSDSETTPFYGKITVNGGRVHVSTLEIKQELGIDGSVDAASNPDFALALLVKSGEDKVKLTGKIDQKMVGVLDISSDQLDVASFAPWAARYAKVNQAGGLLQNVSLRWANSGSTVDLSGRGDLNGLRGSYNYNGQTFTGKMTGPVDFTNKEVFVHKMQVEVNGQKAVLSGMLDYQDLDNLEGDALLSAQELSYEGYTVSNLLLPVSLHQKKVLVNAASLDYGQGKIKLTGSYELDKGELLALADVAQVKLNLSQWSDAPQAAAAPVLLNGSFGARGILKDGEKQVNVVANAGKLAWQNIELMILDFDAQVDEQGYTVQNFTLVPSDGSDGVLAASGNGDFEGNFKFQGRLAEFNVTPLLALAGQEGSGKVSSSFKVSRDADGLNFDGMTQILQGQISSLQIPEAHGLLHMEHNLLAIKDYQVNLLQGRHLINGSVNLGGSDPVLNLKVETKGVRAEPMAALAGNLNITGNVDNQLNIQGTAAHPRISGLVNLTDGSANGYLIDQAAGKYAYDDGSVTLQDCVVRALGTTLTLNGSMDLAQNLNFKAEAKNVDLHRLPINEETVDLTGMVSAQGSLTGTLKQPLFAGQLNSKSFTVNGEEVLNFKGRIVSNGRDLNHIQGDCEQKPAHADTFDSLYAVDLNLNREQRFLQGEVRVSYGNLKSLLKMGKVGYDIDGTVEGSLTFNKNGKGSGVEADTYIYDVKLQKQKYYRMALQAHLKDRILYFDNVRLEEKEGQTDHGFIAVGGTIDLKNRQYKMEAGAVGANPAIITALMADPVKLTGSMNMVVQLNGSFDNPDGNASVELNGGSIAGFELDKAVGMLTLRNDNLKLEQLLLTRDSNKLTAYGDMPVDLFRAREARHNPDAQMNIKLNLNEADLAVLGAFKGIDWGMGATEGVVTVGGTLEEPLLNGEFKVVDGAVKVHNITTIIDKINVDITFAGNKVLVNNVSTNLGKGKLVGSGTYALRSTAKDAYQVNLKATNAEIVSNLFTGRINCDATIKPEAYYPHPVEGQAPPKHLEPGYRPTLKADLQLDDVVLNMPAVPSFGESQSNIGLDVTVKLGPKIHLYNKYFYDMWLSGGLKINGGSDFPIISGKVMADKGTATYLRTNFKMKEAYVTWMEPGNVLPHVVFEATTKFSRYTIEMKITGPLEHMDLQLSSDPVLTRAKIIRMLTLQRMSAGSDEVTNQDLQNLLVAGLQTAVLGDVEQMIKRTFGIDQFKLYMGRLNSGVDIDTSKLKELTDEERNQYNFLLSKNVNEHWSVGYTSSFNGVYKNYYTSYEIGKHINFTMARDQDSRNKYSLQYRISF